ncbi:MAG: diacylglycerol kinase family protein [Weeksellaceae bacterium]|nr:diacylglycerol kinase family protein [Weeksellaceae bacterium]
MAARNILFVVNRGSGNKDTDCESQIRNQLSDQAHINFDIFYPEWDHNPNEQLQQRIVQGQFDTVVASGGDGTVRFVAKNIYGKQLKMGILPTGSANGLAKNLNLPLKFKEALQVITEGSVMPMSSITVNNEFCIHLADIGLNAAIVKRFEEQKRRGIVGYAQAFLNVFFKQAKVHGQIIADGQRMSTMFYMLVFCNGTGYGTGLSINPLGKLYDHKFEVVSVEKLDFMEAMRLYWGQDKPSPVAATITSCREVSVHLARPVHLQVDGEYLKKTRVVKAYFNDLFIETYVPHSSVTNEQNPDSK